MSVNIMKKVDDILKNCDNSIGGISLNLQDSLTKIINQLTPRELVKVGIGLIIIYKIYSLCQEAIQNGFRFHVQASLSGLEFDASPASITYFDDSVNS